MPASLFFMGLIAIFGLGVMFWLLHLRDEIQMRRIENLEKAVPGILNDA